MKQVSVREFRKNLSLYLQEPCTITSRGAIIATVVPAGRKLVIHEKKEKPLNFRDIPNTTPDVEEIIVEPTE